MTLLKTAPRALLPIAIALLCLPASADQPPAPMTPEAAFLGDAPRTYGGDLPCADCEGIRVTLDLHPDRSFVLREEYLGKNRASVDLGRWSLAADGKLTLRGGAEAPWYLRAAGPEKLRKLDKDGKEIVSKLNYDLSREATYRLIEDPIRLSGTYTYVADVGRMSLCLTGQDLRVVPERDNAALEREYAAKRSTPGAPLLVTFTGHFAERAKADGGGKETALVVEKLEKLSPGEPCPPLPGDGGTTARRTPEGRTWTVVSLRGKAVSSGRGIHAVELTFGGGTHHVQGTTGCNRLNGRYTLEGDGLRFADLVTTRKACRDGGEQERAFVQALGDVTGWRFTGNRLQLLGRSAVVVELTEKEED